MSSAASTPKTQKYDGEYHSIGSGFYLSFYKKGDSPTIENKRWKFEYMSGGKRVTIPHMSSQLEGYDYWKFAWNTYTCNYSNPSFLYTLDFAKLAMIAHYAPNEGRAIIIGNLFGWIIKDLIDYLELSTFQSEPVTNDLFVSELDVASNEIVERVFDGVDDSLRDVKVNISDIKDALGQLTASVTDLKSVIKSESSKNVTQAYERQIKREYEAKLKHTVQAFNALQEKYRLLNQTHKKGIYRRIKHRQEAKKVSFSYNVRKDDIKSYRMLKKRYEALFSFKRYLFPISNSLAQQYIQKKERNVAIKDNTLLRALEKQVVRLHNIEMRNERTSNHSVK